MLWITQALLLIIFVFTFNYLWSRRRFYYLSWYMKGPTAYPFIGNAWMFLNQTCGTINLISKLGQKYGTLSRFWLGNRMLVYIDSPVEMETLIKSDIQDKGAVYDSISDFIGGHGLLSLNGNTWKVHRKLLNHTVQHYSILNAYSPIFDEKIKTLIGLLKEKDGGTLDIYSFIESAAAEFVCSTTFGVNLKLQQNENNKFLDAVNFVALKSLNLWYQNKLVMRLSKYHKMYVARQSTIREFAEKIYAQKLTEFNRELSKKENGAEDDLGIKQSLNFIDECIRLTVTQKCFTEQDAITESMSMLLAGFETTAGTVSNAILMLAMHPEFQNKVFEEIENVLPHGQSTVTADVINQLEFTDQLIKETLRLFPIIPLITRIARNVMKIGEYNIPTGTEFILSIFDLHRKTSIWGPNADKFDPNNFLPENVADRHPHSFIPFSFGSVMRLLIASLVRSFIFSTELKYEKLSWKWAITLKLENDYLVKLSKRNFC